MERLSNFVTVIQKVHGMEIYNAFKIHFEKYSGETISGAWYSFWGANLLGDLLKQSIKDVE